MQGHAPGVERKILTHIPHIEHNRVSDVCNSTSNASVVSSLIRAIRNRNKINLRFIHAQEAACAKCRWAKGVGANPSTPEAKSSSEERARHYLPYTVLFYYWGEINQHTH